MLDNRGSEGTWEAELHIYALFLRNFKPELEIHNNYCLLNSILPFLVKLIKIFCILHGSSPSSLEPKLAFLLKEIVIFLFSFIMYNVMLVHIRPIMKLIYL